MTQLGVTRIEKKLNLFGHICRLPDDRLLKQVVFGIMEGPNRRDGQMM